MPKSFLHRHLAVASSGLKSLAFVLAMGSAQAATATEVAVAFRDVGYGTFDGSQLQNIGSPASLLSVPGISNVEFVQDTASGRFEAIQTGCDSQGNDVAVTLRLTVDPAKVAGSTNGTISFLVCVNWLDQPGGKIEGFGFMLPEGESVSIANTFNPAKSLYFDRVGPTDGTNFFADLTKSGGNRTYVFDGTAASSFIGSANFRPASLVQELNTYYDAVTATVPELTVTKTATDSDASVPNAKSGDSIGWIVTAKNTGTSNLVYSAFADSFATTRTYLGLDTNSDGTVDNAAALTNASVLQPGQTWRWTVSHTLTQTEVNAGKVENVASVAAAESGTSTAVTAYSAANGVASTASSAPAASGGAIVLLPASPAIDGVKTAAITNDVVPSGLSAGDTVTYTVAATNTGNVTLTGVTVQSDTLKKADLTSATNSLGSFTLASGSTTLAPGATASFHATYLVAQADIDAGGLTNTATVAGTPPTGAAVTDVTDDGDDTDGNTTNDQTLLAVTASPAMTVKKVADATALSAAPKVGEVISYTITVANSGNATLSGVTLVDALTTDETYVSGDANTNSKLDLGETWSYSASHALTQADIDAGKVENLAVASANPPSGSGDRISVESSSASTGNATAGTGNGAPTTTTLAASPAMTVKKVADATALSAAPKVGEVISYTITVANSGNATLSGVTLVDALTTDETYVSGDANTNAKLDLGETWTYSASHALTQADIDAGKVENLAVASANPPSGSGDRISVESSSASTGNATAGTGNGAPTTTTLAASPAMTVKKVADATALSAAPKVGEVISYTINVANSGNATLSGVTLVDALTTDEAYVSGDANTNAKLDLGETWTYSASHALTQGDIDAGKVENLAVASANPPSGSGDRISVESSSASTGNATAGTGNGAPTTTTLAAKAVISVKKTVDDSALDDGVRVGDTLLYTIEVENTGNVTLTNVTLDDAFRDAKGNSLTLTSGPTPRGILTDDTLDVGEVWTFDASFRLDAGAIAAGGVENLATVTGTPPSGPAVSAESKVTGNNTDSGEATGTQFPGEIGGTVREYLAPQAGVTVYLLTETAPGVYDYVLDNGVPRSVVTAADGSYAFTGLPPGTYGVEFASDPSAPLTAVSQGGAASGNRITDLSVDAGAMQVRQDAFSIDPSGVVYDSETFAPLAGAKVTLEYNGIPVPDDWLNTTLGQTNGSVTDSSGIYVYILDPSIAPSGTYRLRVERPGYKPSAVYKPAAGAMSPSLGGGIQPVVADAVPTSGTSKLYYMSFDFVFVPSNIANTSNGVVHNHIPLDADLLPMVKADVEAILRDDLAMTLQQQGKTMQGYAEAALKRLQSQDKALCQTQIETILAEQPITFDGAALSPGSEQALDRIAAGLRRCPDSRFEIGVYADAQEAADAAQGLTDARAAAIVAGLRDRHVDGWQIAARGYGAAGAGRAGKGGVVLTLIEDAPGANGCVDTSTASHSFDSDSGANGNRLDAGFNREDRECATGSWRILSGSARHMSSDGGLSQTMVNLSVRKERLVGTDRLQGHFIGAYATRSDISAGASGTILGFGLNAGLYGAQRLGEDLYFDYYLGLAAGRHGFDFAFDRVGGVIDAHGAYTYGALFAGAALSGEAQAMGLAFTPRAGIDLAWSPGGNGDLTLTRGLLKDAGSVTVPEVIGMRLFASVRVEDLLPGSPMLLSVTPGLFCDHGFNDLTTDCGLSARIELSQDDAARQRNFDLALDLEGTATSLSTGLELRYSHALGAGQLEESVTLGSAGSLVMNAQYGLKF
ncbi:DUF7507 domain-containing protein [Paragemmobacter straminiformis]|uniref:DUF11 domain-containing protein n=1 Tax=Paragemmobacter straminiformis TaxID=2045119 RepID=A0A842IBS6_9RHOB|nr:DUF11 domain-containing protein [Gemmobacter straminiformis]MBC2836554.1 DUF11 domain-containing protein [Gemmobacter straminiformis]